MTKPNRPPSLMTLRWFRTFIVSLALFFVILFVLPLLYELFVTFTPPMDVSTERTTRRIMMLVSNVFSWVVLFLGLALSWRQRRTQMRREYLHKRVLERRQDKRREAEQARIAHHEKIYGRKPRDKTQKKPD